MRFVVLAVGVLGGVVAAALGMNWIAQYNDLQRLMAREDIQQVVQSTDMTAQVAAATSLMRASYVLLAGLVLGIAGGVMAVRRQGRLAAGLMIAAPVIAAVMAPTSLVASALLLIGGALALLVKAPAASAPAAAPRA
jgi:hypothetical protein